MSKFSFADRKLVPDEALSYISGDAFHNKKEVMRWLEIERLAKLYEQREAREAKPAKPIPQAEKPDRLEEMAEEIQSDEEDMLVDEKDTDKDTVRHVFFLIQRSHPWLPVGNLHMKSCSNERLV